MCIYMYEYDELKNEKNCIEPDILLSFDGFEQCCNTRPYICCEWVESFGAY